VGVYYATPYGENHVLNGPGRTVTEVITHRHTHGEFGSLSINQHIAMEEGTLNMKDSTAMSIASFSSVSAEVAVKLKKKDCYASK